MILGFPVASLLIFRPRLNRNTNELTPPQSSDHRMTHPGTLLANKQKNFFEVSKRSDCTKKAALPDTAHIENACDWAKLGCYLSLLGSMTTNHTPNQVSQCGPFSVKGGSLDAIKGCLLRYVHADLQTSRTAKHN